jgi:VTC domain
MTPMLAALAAPQGGAGRLGSGPAPAFLQAPFRPITLAALNAKAAMLERLDNKYVVRADVLRDALPALAERFDMLEIDGRRAFTYETCYFDDAERRSYFDHHQGRRQRMKVRVRKYTDAGLCFVEVKLKDKRGVTVKKRLPYELHNYGRLDRRACAHVEQSYRALYAQAFGLALEATLEMSYQRLTLVARDGGERMTIDGGIRFRAGGQERSTDDDTFIVETKSANGNGIADKILRALHQHPTDRCSKYCVGMSLTGAVAKHNRFLPALRKLGALPLGREDRHVH